MKEDTFYFSHDYSARADWKIKKLLIKHGYLGYGIYWALIEDLYNNANALQTDYEGIAYDLRQDMQTVKSIINDFELFVVSGEYFGSNSVAKRLKKREEKSNKAKLSAQKRWQSIPENANASEDNANALRPEYESNAIKERKGKENKVNNINTEIQGEFLKDENFEKAEQPKRQKKLVAMPREIFNPFPDSFLVEWENWKAYKNDEFKIKYKSAQSEQAAITELFNLSKGDEQTAKLIIAQSMAKSWKGFFELKTTNHNGATKKSNNTGTFETLERLRKLTSPDFAGSDIES